jgi:hypothetical protein
MCVNSLLGTIDLFTIFERRQIFLLKFVMRELCNTIFLDWFVKSKLRGDHNLVRLVATTARHRHSIISCAISNWNKFIEGCKPNDKTSLSEFVVQCKKQIVKDRENMYIMN